MYSIPNFIPERPGTIRRALTLGEPFAFVHVYGRVLGTRVSTDGAAAVRRSAERCLHYVQECSPDPHP
ncbi:hypothetical protein [Streptomyces sp. MBT27]|uniref:hypothetical protein n=1 Tax=Streptomyces sp. MBT27 TaxID=1488356 RepID=UPI001F082379|nr:hypothetical protein [Streptomyces sp. MBT27]